MTRYLLDTTALIDVSRGYEPVRSEVEALVAAREEVGVSPISVAEFYSGLRAEERIVAAGFLDTLEIWNLDRDIAAESGTTRYGLARRGHSVSLPDALIAATARSVGAALLTNNVRHFPLLGITVLRLGR